jgi:hypothetical protein
MPRRKIKRKTFADEFVGVILTVDDAHLSKIAHIAQKVGNTGVRNIHVSPVLGTITGEVRKRAFAGLRQLEGVSNVEAEGFVRAV